MKLYYYPGACSLAPHIVLRELGLDFVLDRVDLAGKTTQDGTDFLSINAKGQVPALALDDGSVLSEVPVIVQYLADRQPHAELAPAAGTFARYRLQEWLNFITAEVHKGFSPLFRADLPEPSKQYATENIARRFDYLDAHLAGNEFLLDDRFGVADSYAFAIVNWSNPFGIDLSPWANLRRYMDRIAARPSVRDSLQAEGLTYVRAA